MANLLEWMRLLRTCVVHRRSIGYNATCSFATQLETQICKSSTCQRQGKKISPPNRAIPSIFFPHHSSYFHPPFTPTPTIPVLMTSQPQVCGKPENRDDCKKAFGSSSCSLEGEKRERERGEGRKEEERAQCETSKQQPAPHV